MQDVSDPISIGERRFSMEWVKENWWDASLKRNNGKRKPSISITQAWHRLNIWNDAVKARGIGNCREWIKERYPREHDKIYMTAYTMWLMGTLPHDLVSPGWGTRPGRVIKNRASPDRSNTLKEQYNELKALNERLVEERDDALEQLGLLDRHPKWHTFFTSRVKGLVLGRRG